MASGISPPSGARQENAGAAAATLTATLDPAAARTTTPVPVPYGMRPYAPAERRSIQAHLERPLGSDSILQRDGPGGKPVEYISASDQFGMVNLAFGFNGWSTEIKDFTVDYSERDKRGLWEVGVAAVVRVCLPDGSFHEDVGYGDAKGPSKAMVFGNARKAAVTDATKRAVRLFGQAVGLCVGDKEFLKYVKVDKKNNAPPKKSFANPVRQSEAHHTVHASVHAEDNTAGAAAGHITSPYVPHTPVAGSSACDTGVPTPSAMAAVSRAAAAARTDVRAVLPPPRPWGSGGAASQDDGDDDDDAAMLAAGEEFESAMLAASVSDDEDADYGAGGAHDVHPAKKHKASAGPTKR